MPTRPIHGGEKRLQPSTRPNPTRTSSIRSRTEVVLFAPRYEAVKRAFDLVAGSILFVLALPLMGVCAAVIWYTERGPILFRQPRTGLGGRPFEIYKLHTMVPNADELKGELAHLNRLSGPDFKVELDPRVTRVGGFLRRTSLDELPQLWNVIRGDMSLVGPRPTSFLADEYDLWHTERLEVRPGITGLWQVSGRSEIDFDERVRLDVEYIENRGMWLDLRILFRTIGAVCNRRGAY